MSRAAVRPANVAASWPGPNPLDVQNAITVPAASSHRNGLLLLFAAGALLLLVFASGSTLRMLVRMERGLKTG